MLSELNRMLSEENQAGQPETAVAHMAATKCICYQH